MKNTIMPENGETKALPKLTRKQAVFVRELIDNPKQSNTKAAMVAYNTNQKIARTIAAENMAKPSIRSHLENAVELVEDTLITTVRDWGRSDNTRRREISQNAAMWIHDKVHGKATQRIESQSTSINLTIDLSGDDGVTVDEG